MAGSWESLQPFEPQGGDPPAIVAIHLIHLPNGKFLAFQDHTKCRLWTPPPITAPGRGDFEAKPNSHNYFFCSGHCALPDGRVFVGGGGWGAGLYASKLSDVFDPAGSGAWNPSPYPPPDMEYNRWYPTCTMLGNDAMGNPHMKVLVTLGRINRDIPGHATQNEIYDPASPPGSWDLGATISQYPATYPFCFVLPDGRIFCAGPRDATRILDAGLTAWTSGPTNSEHSERSHCSAVMFAPGKILKVGGSSAGNTQACNKVSLIDMTTPSPTWQFQGIEQMEYARRNHNLTILPDGKVLITGGNLQGSQDYPVLEAELYDPVANTMTELPPMEEEDGERWYHSTAALLPDGRVVVAGGDNRPSQQIFRPPYLDGSPTRPEIANAPSAMNYAGTYSFNYTPTGMKITDVALIKLASVTHSFCQDQRRVPLAFSADEGDITVVSPANANIAPPGFYMLFLINDEGVPSESVYVKIQP